MAVTAKYVGLKAKAKEKPWYIRWVWWLVAAGVGVLVFVLWYFAKRKEADLKAKAKVADDLVKQAEIDAKNAADEEQAAELLIQAKAARTMAADIAREVEESSLRRKELEAAIKGATSWEELDKIEEGIE